MNFFVNGNYVRAGGQPSQQPRRGSTHRVSHTRIGAGPIEIVMGQGFMSDNVNITIDGNVGIAKSNQIQVFFPAH